MKRTPAALFFDFNGTLSDDEEIFYAVYAEMLAARGVELSRQRYFDELVGSTDQEIFERMLGNAPDVGALIEERIERYASRAEGGASISEQVRAAVRAASMRVPVGIVTSAFRQEVVPLLRAAEIDHCFSTLVFADNVDRCKPDPEPYTLACSRLGVPPHLALAVEDSSPGVRAAKEAGLMCAAVLTTTSPERLGDADILLDAIDADAVHQLLSGAPITKS